MLFCQHTELYHTWIVNGVSFFLLTALSSIVSGTERLIILLSGGKIATFEQHPVFNLNKLLHSYNAHHSTFLFISSPLWVILVCFSIPRLCKSDVHIYVIKNVFGMYLKLIAKPETLNISLATIDLSCWSKKSTWIIHKCSHWTTEHSLLCCQVLQCSKTTLFLLLYRCTIADKKNCTRKKCKHWELSGEGVSKMDF